METPQKYMRIRPKDDARAAFYAPSADVTHGMKGVIRTVLENVCTEEVGEGHPLVGLARNLAEFMKRAALSEQTWERDGLPLLGAIFQGVKDEDRERFLEFFFATMMDFYWHSMRLTTESPCIRPEEMEKALRISELVRTMPVEMREAYMDHLLAHNMSPQIFQSGGLFVSVST
jgi:hypothetical protein